MYYLFFLTKLWLALSWFQRLGPIKVRRLLAAVMLKERKKKDFLLNDVIKVQLQSFF